MDKEKIKNDIIRVANKLNKRPSRDEYLVYGKYSKRNIDKVFGSYSAAIFESGVEKIETIKNLKKLRNELVNYDSDCEKEIIEEMEKHKEKVKEKVTKRYYEQLKKQKMIGDLVIETIEGCAASLEANELSIKVIPSDTKKCDFNKSKAILWLDFSDSHIGELVKKEVVGGLGEHNWQIWEEKLSKWVNKVINKIRNLKNIYNIEKVIIAFLGDIIDGDSIYRSHTYNIDTDKFFQITEGSEDITNALVKIASTFPNIDFEIYGTGGNHGRDGRKGEKPYHINFDLMVYKFIETRLKCYNLKNIQFNFSIVWFSVVSLFYEDKDCPVKETGWLNLIQHGDGIPQNLGIPFYGISRSAAKYDKMLQKCIHYRHLGHFHTGGDLGNSAGADLLNGCFPGGNEFSAKDLAVTSRPEQRGYLFTPQEGIVDTYRFYLSDFIVPDIKIYGKDKDKE